MNRCGFSQAVADVSGSTIHGTVCLFQQDNGVLVTADIEGLPRDGFFAFHIHEGSDCGGPICANTGGHYNPTATAHPDHAGDLPPLLSCGGRAYLSVLTDRFRAEDVIGRTVVIHSSTDDFRSQPAGDSGSKIACGVFRRCW